MADERTIEDFPELWRYICINDEELRKVIGNRAYPTHITQVTGPKYPCGTLHDFDATPDVGIPALKYGNYLMESWADTDVVAKTIQNHFERLFHTLAGKRFGITIGQCYMLRGPKVGPFDQEKSKFHRMSYWRVDWWKTA